MRHGFGYGGGSRQCYDESSSLALLGTESDFSMQHLYNALHLQQSESGSFFL